MSPATSSCPKCTSEDLLVVQMAPKGKPMRFHTCRHCEHRWWEDADVGTDIDLTTVLHDLST